MFIGEFEHHMDDKGRLVVPAAFREKLSDDFIITRGLDTCLFVYPKEEWMRLEAKLRELPFTKKDARAFTRFFFSGAAEGSVDKQHRMKVPGNLQQYAGLEKECLWIGVSSRVEIWDKHRWDTYIDTSSEVVSELAEQLFDFE
ncbi:division/cell wall cluster transcriptional repressor MraZ [Alkalicoccus chagannorensis]|uniref:division/cell wall cluster transcriptional repressor MraZ n=1 Tax=Alkalicoccus chagannorensis TaxID=427072 RepID=UPI0004030927|nr:division/cell wall cluster transcriptional repressor MraZ [Alkalicoccus chagannorensis]